MALMVNTIGDFKDKWGTRSPSMLIDEFIARSPDFPGKHSLETNIREMMSDFEAALKTVGRAHEVADKVTYIPDRGRQ